jgi:integrase
MARLYKRDNSPNWWFEFVHRGHRYRRSTSTSSKKQAAKILAQEQADVYRQAARDLPSLSLRQAVDRYVETVTIPKGRPASAKETLYLLEMALKRFGDDTLLHDITTADVSAWRDSMLAKGLVSGTVRRRMAALRPIFTRAQRSWHVLESAPLFDLPPEGKGRERYLSPEEEQRLLEVCPEHLNHFCVLAVDTGGRHGEVCRLTWGNVSLGKGTARGHVTFTDTKSGKPRSVPLTKRAEALLRDLKAARKPSPEERVILFERADGALLPANSVRRAFEKARDKAGLADVRAHDLRHTFASRLVQRGAGLTQVKELMGHATIAMVQRYAHLSTKDLHAAISVLD